MLLTRSLLATAIVPFHGCAFLVLVLGAISAGQATSPTALTVNNFGDAGPGNCTSTCTLRDAIFSIASGGTIDFAPSLLPETITLTLGQISLLKALIIQGPGAAQLTVSAAGASRLFDVYLPPAITIRVAGLTLREGALAALDGGDGAPGTSLSGDGKDGGSGYAEHGGCIEVVTDFAGGSLILDGVDLRNCSVQGGHGGKGGAGAASVSALSAGGGGGKGGSGGAAAGACIWFGGVDINNALIGDLILRNSSVTHCQANAGKGGAGGDGGTAPVFHGAGGAGGFGAYAFGGAIFFRGNALSIRNSTIGEAVAVAGDGGAGGTGSTYALYPGGAGGDGGVALGGLLYANGDGRLEFATLASGDALAGGAGSGGPPHVPSADGAPGQALGAAFSGDQLGGPFEYLALSTAVVGSSSTPLCSGLAGAVGSINLAESGSCPSDLQGTLAQVFRPFDSSQPLPAYVPVYHSKANDAAAACNDLTPESVTADQHGTPRPQGSVCDIGAIEADYIVDPFE